MFELEKYLTTTYTKIKRINYVKFFECMKKDFLFEYEDYEDYDYACYIDYVDRVYYRYYSLFLMKNKHKLFDRIYTLWNGDSTLVNQYMQEYFFNKTPTKEQKEKWGKWHNPFLEKE